MGDSKGSSFKENLALTIVGIILTSILGSGLTYLFTYRQWQYSVKQEIMETRVRDARETLLKTVQLCQDRWLASQRLIWAYETPTDFDLKEIRTEYDNADKEWNLNLLPQRVQIQEYFGNDCANLFVDDAMMEAKTGGVSVHATFFKFNQKVILLFHKSTLTTSNANLDQMQKGLQNVSASLKNLYQTMSNKYEQLQNGYLVQ
jgi:hypothetical protein